MEGPTNRPRITSSLVASCPLLCCVSAQAIIPLPIQQLDIIAECQICTGFVTVKMTCYYPPDWKSQALMLFFPKTQDTVITDVELRVPGCDEMFVTAVVPKEDVRQNGYSSGQKSEVLRALDVNDPELFSVQFPAGQPGSHYHVAFSYFHPLAFDEGKYVLRVPCTIPYNCISPGTVLSQVLDAKVLINSGTTEPLKSYAGRHALVATEAAPNGRVVLTTNKQAEWPNTDIEVGYQVWGSSVSASVNVQPHDGSADNPDPRGTFCLSVAPPFPESTTSFQRSVVFVLDRSGSMNGPPMQHAKQAILHGLTLLTPGDYFTVVAFDHEQLWWSEHIVQATAANIAACSGWIINVVQARGLTDILSPLQQAMNVLLRTPVGLPFVFLMTDGAVDNERDICQYVISMIRDPTKAEVTLPRISTFGIGQYCNHYFLKQLATLGRGFFDVAFRPHHIFQQVTGMMIAAQKPVLSNLTVTIPGVSSCELFPYPIPDLFCGQPVLVCGKWEGNWPEAITLNGALPNGQVWSLQIKTNATTRIPLHKVFVKQQLDAITAAGWLEDDQQQVKQAVQLSCAASVVCPHTQMVGFQTTPQEWAKMQAKIRHNKRVRIAKYAIGGAAAVAVVAGAVAFFAFGSVGATVANAPIGDAAVSLGGAGDLLGGGGGGGGGDCCGCDGCDGCGDCCDCDCDCDCDCIGDECLDCLQDLACCCVN